MQNREEQPRFAYTSRLQPRAKATAEAPASTMPWVKDMNGEPIRRGDQVFTPVRDGRHEGLVEMIVTGDEDAGEEDMPSTPKVVYVDYQGNVVAHDPEALRHVEKAGLGSEASAGSDASEGGDGDEKQGQRRMLV